MASWTRRRTSPTSTTSRSTRRLEKAGDFADEKTGGKYDEQIDHGVDTAQERTGDGDTSAVTLIRSQSPGSVPAPGAFSCALTCGGWRAV